MRKLLLLLLLSFLMAPGLRASDDVGIGSGFVPNYGQVADVEGQTSSDVLFTYESPGMRMFFKKDRIVYVFYTYEFVENEKSRKAREMGDLELEKYHSLRIKQEFFELEFLNANPNAHLVYANRQKNFQNFYFSHCPQGITNVPIYNEAVYVNVFPKVSLKFKVTESGLKYDLILEPGANLSDIKFRYNGIKELILDEGVLTAKFELDALEEQIPFSYYSDNNQSANIGFELLNDNVFGFSLDGQDAVVNRPMIIDPTLTWSTYFERTTAGYVGGIRGNTEVDENGNLFFQVNTYYADLPIGNPGGVVYLDPSLNASGLDIYFAMFTPDRELFWSTYLGGTDSQSSYYDHGLSISGNTLYVCGSSDSDDFPLLNQGGGAYYATHSGTSQRGFLSKFSTITGQMIHSTYINCFGYLSMDVDNNGNVALATFCYDFSPTADVVNRTGAYNDATFNGSESEIFIYMFDSSMVQIWGTYFGGTGYSDPMGLAFDSNNNLFILSRSDEDAAMPLLNPGGGAYYDGTVQDKFDLGISKFSSAGVLQWSTYLGGSGLEGLSYSNISVNSSDEVIITSQTSSTDIAVLDAGGTAYYQGTPPTGLVNGWGGTGNSAGYFAKFSNTGVMQHATYIGMDNESDYIQDNNVGYCDRLYLIISTKTFPQTTLSGSYNVANSNPANTNYMMMQLDADLTLSWATYLQPDSCYYWRNPVDLNNGRLYATGTTNKTNFNSAYPGSPAYIDTTIDYASSNLYTLMEFDIGGAPVITVSGGGSDTICEGGSITLNASGNGTLNWYDAASGGNQIGTGLTLTLNNLSGDTTVWVEAVDGSCISPRIEFHVYVIATVDAAINPVGPFCVSGSVETLTAVNSGGIWSGTGITSSSAGTFDPVIAGVGTHEVTYTTASLCNDTDTIYIVVVSQLDATITAAGPFCNIDSIITLTAASSGGTWSGTGITNGSTGAFNPFVAGLGTHTITYAIAGDCGDTATIDIIVQDCTTGDGDPHAVVPNAFSPNGDGENDILFVRGSGVTQLNFIVYDRWGEKVFETSELSIGWDGTFRGKDMDAGVFVYYLNVIFDDGTSKTEKGNITLIK
ncbi:MAG: gliding motility-associated C-terminal domain-containing protein [Bacteroidales bacterium]|nr:gliding motility-associated C-terminal domain-containing protein [Bacteroidales bacterium]